MKLYIKPHPIWVRGLKRILCAMAVIVFFSGISGWEGSAKSDSQDELPPEGYYVATNSFPQYTVVDITNLENGNVVRAAVCSRLDNSGLLALLSKEAAAALGLPSQSPCTEGKS